MDQSLQLTITSRKKFLSPLFLTSYHFLLFAVVRDANSGFQKEGVYDA